MLVDSAHEAMATSLWPANEVLGIAEGVETAIAAKMLHDIPKWAALNTGLLKAFIPPRRITGLVIFGDIDHNHAGQAAAHALAHRLHGQIKVEVKFPSRVGQNFNDVVLEQK